MYLFVTRFNLNGYSRMYVHGVGRVKMSNVQVNAIYYNLLLYITARIYTVLWIMDELIEP